MRKRQLQGYKPAKNSIAGPRSIRDRLVVRAPVKQIEQIGTVTRWFLYRLVGDLPAIEAGHGVSGDGHAIEQIV
jgi:hypothetical protein